MQCALLCSVFNHSLCSVFYDSPSKSPFPVAQKEIPSLRLGQRGLSPEVLDAIGEHLRAREMVKVATTLKPYFGRSLMSSRIALVFAKHKPSCICHSPSIDGILLLQVVVPRSCGLDVDFLAFLLPELLDCVVIKTQGFTITVYR